MAELPVGANGEPNPRLQFNFSGDMVDRELLGRLGSSSLRALEIHPTDLAVEKPKAGLKLEMIHLGLPPKIDQPHASEYEDNLRYLMLNILGQNFVTYDVLAKDPYPQTLRSTRRESLKSVLWKIVEKQVYEWLKLMSTMRMFAAWRPGDSFARPNDHQISARVLRLHMCQRMSEVREEFTATDCGSMSGFYVFDLVFNARFGVTYRLKMKLTRVIHHPKSLNQLASSVVYEALEKEVISEGKVPRNYIEHMNVVCAIERKVEEHAMFPEGLKKKIKQHGDEVAELLAKLLFVGTLSMY